MRIREIANTRIRYGFERIYTLLRREVFTDNHKRVYRIYRAEGLNLRSKRPRCNRTANHCLERLNHQAINQVWSMDFSRPGKPTDNPCVESFNGKFRDERLNVNWFLSLEDAAKKIEDFRWENNHFRPYSSINDLTPKEFIILHENTPETLIAVG